MLVSAWLNCREVNNFQGVNEMFKYFKTKKQLKALEKELMERQAKEEQLYNELNQRIHDLIFSTLNEKGQVTSL